MMIICAKSFLNPTMHNKVMGRTRTGFTEVYAQSLSTTVTLILNLATWFLFATHCLVFKFHLVRLSYGPDQILEQTDTHIDTQTHGQVRLYALSPFQGGDMKIKMSSAAIFVWRF